MREQCNVRGWVARHATEGGVPSAWQDARAAARCIRRPIA
jgi:hypothetical protein